MAGRLWAIAGVLFLCWVVGSAVHFGNGLIHVLLVGAIVLFIVSFVKGQRARI
jgi:hypothetical protein